MKIKTFARLLACGLVLASAVHAHAAPVPSTGYTLSWSGFWAWFHVTPYDPLPETGHV